jgi:hypothetical protein
MFSSGAKAGFVFFASDAGTGSPYRPILGFILEHAAKVLLTAAPIRVHRLPHEQRGIYDPYDRGHARRSTIARRMA